MQLIVISPSRHPPKVWLKFSNDNLLPFKLDDVVTLGLKKFADLNDEILEKIYQTSLKFVLLEYALRQVAISPKTEKVILPKLKQKLSYLIQKYHYPESNYSFLIDEILEYLKTNDLLKKDEYKRYLINKSKHKSKMEISYLLRSQGLNSSPDDVPDDLPKIRLLVQKKLKNINLADSESRFKLISALTRKGFALNEVKSVIDELTKTL